MNKISVNLNERSYDILIGKDSLDSLSDFLLQKKYSKIFILTDKNVDKHCASRLYEVLNNSKIHFEKIVTEAGEKTKSFLFLEKICEEILEKGLDRKSLIIAFGGGVIGDLSGFIASILLRGIDFVQIPTTLLSMVDSSVGGKTAINSNFGKNLIGSFYQPKLVICDLNFLNSLPQRELSSGYAEVLKYGLIRDIKFFEYLEKNFSEIFNLNEEVLEKIISRSCEIKAEIVGIDEKESGERALLNFGHSFGHIFETEVNYSDEILHGEAVALGMLMACEMSYNFKMIGENDVFRIKNHLEKVGFVIDPLKIRKKWDEKNLVSHIYKDKKNENQNLTFILLEEIGCAVIKKSVDLKEFERVLGKFLDV